MRIALLQELGFPDLDPVVISIEAKLRRAGKGKRLVIENGVEAKVNAGLVELIKEAFATRPRWVKNSRSNELFCGFTPAVSATALKAMRTTIRDLKLRSRTDVSLADIARKINPLLRGWIEYYGRYMPSALRPFLRYVNLMLRAWAMRKFKRFAGHTTRTGRFLEKLSQTNPRLFVHWQIGMIGTFA